MRFLREACRRKQATAEIMQQVVAFLNRLERQPGYGSWWGGLVRVHSVLSFTSGAPNTPT